GGDIFHIAKESGVGVILFADAIPIASPAGIADDRSRLDHALNDGEDFELLFTLASVEANRLLADQPLSRFGVPITRIGDITADLGIRLRTADQTRDFPQGGFAHDWSAP